MDYLNSNQLLMKLLIKITCFIKNVADVIQIPIGMDQHVVSLFIKIILKKTSSKVSKVTPKNFPKILKI